MGYFFKRLRDEFASMRPQRNAAENMTVELDLTGTTLASMRPQRNAAENEARGVISGICVIASMRPQRNAAENFTPFINPFIQIFSFNEAAA